MNKNKGITLVAEVITIIILLILAGITLATLTGENGLFKRAKQAKLNTVDAQEKENLALGSYENSINQVIDGTVESSREQITVDKEQYEQLLKDVEDLKNNDKNNNIDGNIEDITLPFTVPKDGFIQIGVSPQTSANSYLYISGSSTGKIYGSSNAGMQYSLIGYVKKGDILTIMNQGNIKLMTIKYIH